MGQLDDLKKHTNKLIDEVESDTDHSRSQSFLEDFWATREKLQEARDTTYGEEKSSFSELLNLLNRNAEENDLEPY
ncbi:hypothetical protein RM549_03120 [Salegentibacter sp. F188]|uniref:Uncharacterized protein n=1 Tax=Autumnicola patrickiae TaxID=3075591 RepID=A0ABU3DYI0_9FLAO|nr:hypothetical protein [Salegentibacter sp. F188]MDT0688757.1 hypothetical protein [Salegentibacter sp. F188]